MTRNLGCSIAAMIAICMSAVQALACDFTTASVECGVGHDTDKMILTYQVDGEPGCQSNLLKIERRCYGTSTWTLLDSGGFSFGILYNYADDPNTNCLSSYGYEYRITAVCFCDSFPISDEVILGPIACP